MSGFDHANWYSIRYQSSKEIQNKNTQQKNLQELQQKRKEKKRTTFENNKLAIDSIGLSYEERNKTLWCITINGEDVYFYPSTNKWRPKGGKTTYYSRGVSDMVGKVLKYQSDTQNTHCLD